MKPVKKLIQEDIDDLVFHYAYEFVTLRVGERVDWYMSDAVWNIVWDNTRYMTSEKVR